MKKLFLTLFILTIISVANGQEQNYERKAGFRGKQASHEMQHLRFAKFILSQNCIREAEITPEQVELLKKAFEVLDKQMVEISRQIGEAAKKQAEVSIKVLTTPGDDGQEMFKMTEEIGCLRTEQAKLSVKVLMVIRDHLNPAQCAKVVQQMKNQRDQMRSRQKGVQGQMQNRRHESEKNSLK